MAKVIQLKHSATGLTKNGFYGFSWTTFFFGPFVPLFRGDFLTFLGYFAVVLIISIFTAGIGGFFCFFIWSFFYNSFYTKKLIERGYEFSGTPEQNNEAATDLGIEVASDAMDVNTTKLQSKSLDLKLEFSRDLKDDAYKIFLVKKYPIEFNDVLNKHVFNNKLYDSIDAVLLALHDLEEKNFNEAESKIIAEKSIQSLKIKNLRLEAKPFLDIILNNKYELLDEVVKSDSIVWYFKVQQSGSVFDIDSLEQLKLFAENFKQS